MVYYTTVQPHKKDCQAVEEHGLSREVIEKLNHATQKCKDLDARSPLASFKAILQICAWMVEALQEQEQEASFPLSQQPGSYSFPIWLPWRWGGCKDRLCCLRLVEIFLPVLFPYRKAGRKKQCSVSKMRSAGSQTCLKITISGLQNLLSELDHRKPG